MTSLASNTSITSAQTSTSPASTSHTSVQSVSPSTSVQSSAAATAGSRPTPVSYAQATKKSSYTPPIVSSSTGPTPPIVSGAQGTNARTSNASPVNGKTPVPPAVPTATPAMSGNVIVNGTSGSSNGHGRKSSIVSGGNGGNAWMANGGLQANRQQRGPIQFGEFPANQPGQPTPGGVPVSSPNLAAPTIPNPRVSSPQMSPSPLPQPAVSGGPLNQGMREQNITFGSLGSNVADRGDQRQMHNRPTPMPIPAAPAAQGPGHVRRESASSHQQQHPEMTQPGMGRGMPPNSGRRNQPTYGGQNSYQAQGYSHNNYSNNRNAPNQNRGAFTSAINTPHYQSAQGGSYPSPQRQPPRSPALHHNVPHTQHMNSLPGTPQLGTVPIAANSPSFQPANLYPGGVQQHQYIPPPTQPGYDHNMANMHYHGYPLYSQPYATGPPPASPRNQFAAMGGPAPYLNMPYPGPPPMSRSPSTAAADIHRPPSGFGIPPNTPLSPPVTTTFTSTPSTFFKKPERVSKEIKIVDPITGITRSFNKPPETSKPRPLVVTSTPVIVSSGSPAPRPAMVDTTKKANEKTNEEKRREIQLQVQKKKEEDEAREKELLEQSRLEEERLKKEAEEAEEAERKRIAEEEECKRKEEEEERLRKEAEEELLRKEAEEKARLEEEERLRKEAEAVAEAARIAKERAEEEARIAKEKEEEERRIREEQEEVERKAKEETDRVAKEAEEQRLKEEAEAKAAAEAEAVAAAAVAQSQEELAEETADKLEKGKPEIESSEQTATSTTAEDTMRPPTKSRGKPSPLILKTSTEPGPPSAALTALRSARFIADINSVKYPETIMSPNPAINSAAPAGKFKYQKEFLLQFQNVFTEKPSQEWDKIIRDTVGEPDSARPPTARMPTSGLGPRGNSRPGTTSAQPSMGTMGSFGSTKFGLPANMLTSAQRFEQSNNRAPGTVSFNPSSTALGYNPLPSLAAVGQSRPGAPSISRTNSSQGLSQQGGSIPQSPRVRSQRGERGSSKRGNTVAGGVSMEKSESKQAEPKPVLTIPPSDIKPLVVSETRWKPRSMQAAASTGAPPGVISAVATPVPTEDNRLSPELVQRKVKAALNKMTPEKFEKISGQILDIASQSKYETDGRTLRQVIQLTFEKATDEAAWSSMYAKFCKVMMESMDPSIKDDSIKDLKTGKVVTGGILFRKYLLNRCQEEFQRGWKVNLPPKPEGETDEAAMLSDEYYIAAAAKRRGLGLIQFIGELFKLGMLTERIMHECVRKLVDFEGVPEEAEVESLCKLLRTIGASLDATDKSRPSMDAYFIRIQTMMNHPELQSRLKFMLMDVVDLRKKHWEVNETDKGPKTLAEIQADVAKAAAEKEAASRANAQRGGRPGGGRGDGRNFSQGYGQTDYQQRQIAQNSINPEDLRKLKQQQRGDRNVNATQNTFGPPSSMFASRGSNPKKMGPPSFNRGEDSGPTSRTATPPSGATTSRNSFHVLGDMGSQANDGDANDSISPAPSAASSPPQAKASPAMRSLSGKE